MHFIKKLDTHYAFLLESSLLLSRVVTRKRPVLRSTCTVVKTIQFDRNSSCFCCFPTSNQRFFLVVVVCQRTRFVRTSDRTRCLSTGTRQGVPVRLCILSTSTRRRMRTKPPPTPNKSIFLWHICKYK